LRIANNEVAHRQLQLAGCAGLIVAVLFLCTGPVYAQSTTDPYQACINAMGIAGCSGGPRAPIPDIRNDLWNAIAFSPSHYMATFAGSFTAPENARAAAMNACAARASDCRIVAAAHDVCIAVAFERVAGGAFRIASGRSKQDAEGKALPVCMAQGPKRCTVVGECSGQPPLLIVTK
jgi:hypothetical protein